MLPPVDPFAQPYDVWETRPATPDEVMAQESMAEIRVKVLERVEDAVAAAAYMAKVHSDNVLGRHIAKALDDSKELKAWRNAMPSKTPPAIAMYQRNLSKSDMAAVSQEIEQYGALLSPGQCLYHGGLWPGGTGLVTDRPLSTSLCPQVALRNAESKAKAYDAGRIDLLVLRVTDPRTKAFAFRRKGSSLGHENEVLFSAGASLKRINEVRVRDDYLVGKWAHPDKKIPAYVLEIEIS